MRCPVTGCRIEGKEIVLRLGCGAEERLRLTSRRRSWPIYPPPSRECRCGTVWIRWKEIQVTKFVGMELRHYRSVPLAVRKSVIIEDGEETKEVYFLSSRSKFPAVEYRSAKDAIEEAKRRRCLNSPVKENV